jgi:hypothetical protein
MEREEKQVKHIKKAHHWDCKLFPRAATACHMNDVQKINERKINVELETYKT